MTPEGSTATATKSADASPSALFVPEARPLLGLDAAQATRRLEEFGPNESPRSKTSPLARILPLLANPLALVLLAASGISAIIGDTVDAAIIATLVALSAAINFVQTWRSQRAAEDLRQRVAPTATVLRDGCWCEIPRRDVVPDDIVRLSAGDLVPADAQLVEARDLHMQESALTGESLPVDKEVSVATGDPRGTVWLGTSVVSGTATARVVATGVHTQFGDAVARMSAKAPETEFERGLRRFGLLITRTVLVLVLVLLAASVAMHRPPFQSLLFAVALAVALTPEFLPMITTVTLAQGAIRMAREHVIVKHLSAIQNLGSIDILCSDKTGTLTSGTMRIEGSFDALGAPSQRLVDLARLNSEYQTGIRSPLDAAILAGATKGAEAPWSKLDEIPFDFERRRLSVIIERGDERLLVTKGAPDAIVAICTGDDAVRARRLEWIKQAGARGARLLAVAVKSVEARGAWTKADECDLELAGVLAFSDPPLPEASEAVAALQRDGVAVKIITGDDPAVACHVCSAVGLDPGRPLLGPEIARMDDGALQHRVEDTVVFARTNPVQKTRILLALKARGHVVGFIGDGINDAPSLHAADVGISVPRAVDVAREAADILLTERGLDVLHGGILAGRRAFGNVMKYLLMGTSSNFGNMLSMAVASLALPFLPMLPTQILLNNLLYDVSQITIPTDNVDSTWLSEPHRSDIDLVKRFMLIIGPISSAFDFITFAVLLKFFHAAPAFFHTGWFVESLCTQTLVLFVIRTFDRPWRSRPSWQLSATILAIVAIGALLPEITPAAKLLGFVPLPRSFFGFVALATAAYLSVVEVAKEALVRRGRLAACDGLNISDAAIHVPH